eukprot:PhF_6_TR19607/c0_g1_i1/m.28607
MNPFTVVTSITWTVEITNPQNAKQTTRSQKVASGASSFALTLPDQTTAVMHLVLKSDTCLYVRFTKGTWLTDIGGISRPVPVGEVFPVYDCCSMMCGDIHVLFSCPELYSKARRLSSCLHPSSRCGGLIRPTVAYEVLCKVLESGDVEPVEECQKLQNPDGFAIFRESNKKDIEGKLRRAALLSDEDVIVPVDMAVRIAWKCKNPFERSMWDRRALAYKK